MRIILDIVLTLVSFGDAFPLFARTHGESAAIPIDVDSAATVEDVAEHIRQYLGITGLPTDAIEISLGGETLGFGVTLADTSIGAETIIDYQILPLAISGSRYLLKPANQRYTYIGSRGCNETFRIAIGHPDFLNELGRQFKLWLSANDRRASQFVDVPISFRIHFARVNTSDGGVIAGLCGREELCHVTVPSHRGFALNPEIKALLVGISEISSHHPVVGNRIVAGRLEQHKGIMRFNPELLDRSRSVCQQIVSGPLSASQFSDMKLYPIERAGMDANGPEEWSSLPEIELYFDMPFGFDLLLM